MALSKDGEYVPRSHLATIRGIEYWWDPLECAIELRQDDRILKTIGLETFVIVYQRDNAIFERYPRPWKLGEEWEGNSEGSAIVDAKEQSVLGFSEWLTCDKDVLKLIIMLINEAK